MSRIFDSEPDWNNVEFLIKWKGQSHLHCHWKSFIELQNVRLSFVLFICINNNCTYVLSHTPFLSPINNPVSFFFDLICNSLIFFLFSLFLYCNTFLCMKVQLSGFKKVLNYTKRVTEEIRYRMRISREEVNEFIYWKMLSLIFFLIIWPHNY